MRILLAQNSLYYPAHGGGDKSNRLLLEALAERGHACGAVARIPRPGPEGHDRYLGDLAAHGVAPDSPRHGVVSFERAGVEVSVATDTNLRGHFQARCESFGPDVILASTDDPAQILLPAALESRVPVVYLARATLALPFGPDCAFPSEAKTAVLARVDRVVGVSEYVARYVRQYGGIDAVHVPISLMDPGPWAVAGRYENEFVTFVNPCAVKGIAIFLELARRMPETRFAAVPMWGTNDADRAALRQLPNVILLDPVDRIDDLLSRTRVLLAPSLWAEARSRMVVEAMLRGVPVLAADVGGIPEAKLGVPYLLPVNPIARYQPRLDEQMVPVAEVPPQDAGPWEEALRRLLRDPQHWAEIAGRSREAALDYATNLTAEPLETLLREAAEEPRRAELARAAAPAARSHLDRLSPEKRRLVALLLRRKAPVDAWFPGIAGTDRAALRLFCFPHAGGGATAYSGWPGRLPAGIAVCPVRLPGRESRLEEAPYTRMQPLVEALRRAIEPYLDRPFGFFGHSMGAVVAFELARRLRDAGEPLPGALLVSAARAPSFRRNYQPPPEPSDAELLDELRRLGGLPSGALGEPGFARLLLPALRADTALYRNYVYAEGPPLACRILAYGGADDPHIQIEHLNCWGEETIAPFSARQFPGGHFYLAGNSREVFLAALASDLASLADP